jgi:Tol biopolymer transport system component
MNPLILRSGYHRTFLQTCAMLVCCAVCGSDPALLLAADEPALSSVEHPPGRLVFSSRRWTGEYFSRDIPGGVESTPVNAEIQTVLADGTDLKPVIALGKRAEYPIPSPDGHWIYFQSNVSGHSQVYRARWDGTELENLTAGDRLGSEWKEAYGFALSADGQRLLFTVHNGQIGQLALADPDGNNPRLIAPHLGYIYMGTLSPKADRLVFSGPAQGYRLWQMSLPAGEPQLLTPDHPDAYAPQFTPDGGTIVFFRRDGDLYRVNVNDPRVQKLTTGNQYVEFRLSKEDRHGSTDGPRISPDGKRIAYLAVRDGVSNVWTISLDGTDPRQITYRTTNCGRVCWSPDGKMLAFVSFVDQYPQLFVVPAGGGEPRQVTRLDAAAVYFVQWGPPRPGTGR